VDAPLLNAVSANLRKIRRMRAARKDAEAMINEAGAPIDPVKHKRELDRLAGAPTKMLATDTGVVFYPGLEKGIPISGPSTPKGMLEEFFKEILPDVYPEAADLIKNMELGDMVELALDHGMVAVFGENGVLNQFMAREAGALSKVADLGVVNQAFDSVDDELVWLNSLTGVKQDLIPSSEVGFTSQ
jgi:hypothetical protein